MIQLEQPLEAVERYFSYDVMIVGSDQRSLPSLNFTKEMLRGFAQTPRRIPIDPDLAEKLNQLSDAEKALLTRISLAPPIKLALVLPEEGNQQPYLDLMNQGLIFPSELSGSIQARGMDQDYIDLLKEAQKNKIQLFSRDVLFGKYPFSLLHPNPLTRAMVTSAAVSELVSSKYRVMVLCENFEADKDRISLAYYLSCGFPEQVVSVAQFDGTLGDDRYRRFFNRVKKEGVEETSFAISIPETKEWGILTEVAIYHPRALVIESQNLLLES